MGHLIHYMDFPYKTSRKEMCRERAIFVEDNGARDGGHLMSSDSGFKLHENIICDSYDDAIEKIQQLDNGWYDDHGVLYRSYQNVKKTKQMLALKEKRQEVLQKASEYKKANDIHNRKSETITCPKCKSRLALAYFCGNNCPLCRTSLLSDTVKNRINAFDTKVKEIDKKYAAEEKKMKDKAELRWLVKLEIHV